MNEVTEIINLNDKFSKEFIKIQALPVFHLVE